MILVFGKTGQVARELHKLGTVMALGREEANLSDPQACADAIRHHSPDAVINAAAYTAVDQAEDEDEDEEVIATVINGDTPTAMAKVCAELGIPFVHISTDYVFEGTGKDPWQPQDQTAPQNAYGRSKLAGETGIADSGGTYAILRTSWVVSAYGTNFIKTMLRLSATRDVLNIVGDQIGGPTPARDIATACLQMAEQLIQEPSKSGIYHFSGTPDVSWADFAREIFEQAGKSVTITPIPTTDYPTPARRPLNSRMDCTATNRVFGIERPDWVIGLKTILNDLEART
ncbi:dTDP-4-dehydrorhamnose reductase [Planktomarina temperata]|nr:dTDP-4-dehydrorhamnose reductase [Planktomarina temperata]